MNSTLHLRAQTQLATIYEISKILTSSLDVAKTCREALNVLANNMGYRRCMIIVDTEDEDWDFYQRVNKETVSLEPVEHKYDVAALKELIREHVEATGSPRGKEILDNFSEYLPKFKKVLPYDYDRMLRIIASMEERGLDGEQAQIEAFYAVQKKK